MRIQHNISALNSYNKLSGNNNRLSKNLEKLSSGYAINRAADNAAGLAISEKMRAQITGLETCQQNSKDGISLVQTAEGALTEVHSMLNRMVALTTQASNGVYTETERTKIQDELDQLNDEIDRIADATNFNGIKLLDGNLTSGGSGSGGTATKSIITQEGMSVTPTYSAAQAGAQTTAALSATTLNGEGASQRITFAFDEGQDALTYDVEMKNGTIWVNGEDTKVTFSATPTAGEVGDALVVALNKDLAGKFEVTNATGALTFQSLVEGKTGVAELTHVTQSAGTNKTGGAGTASAPAVTAGTGTSEAKDAKDTVTGGLTGNVYTAGDKVEDKMFTINGHKFLIAAAATDVSKVDSDINIITGSGADSATAQQLNQILSADGINVTLDTGNLVFTGTPKAGGAGLRLQIGETNDEFNMLDVTIEDCHSDAIGVGKTTMRVDNVDVANEAMMAAKDAVENVSKVRSRLGAIQNRLDHTLANLEETTTNLTEAESRIRDTDMAQEMMKYTKNNILIQSSQAMLAQANQVPQGVLQLLQ